MIWGLLVVNTLGSLAVDTIVPIPRRVLQVITMGSLAVAFVLALLLNRRLRIRPNAFLLLLSLLVVASILSSSFMESGFGALLRCARLAVFVATLWLLTRWWDGGISFVRHHIRALSAVLATVAIGLVISPSMAMPADFDSRLVGIIWPITATQVADYAAVVAGLTLVLWLARATTTRSVVLIAGPALVMLLLTHTRTATIAMLAAIPVAGLTLALTNARARKTIATITVGAAVLAIAFSTALTAWFQRGQDAELFSNLTGRQYVWDALLAQERTVREQLFGVGLTDKSFGGDPIDSTWLAVFHEQGILGVSIVALMLLALVFAMAARPPSPARACAVFLVVYGVIASYTQVALGDVTGYLLHFVLAAALLVPAASEQRSLHSFDRA
ncbi:O-antigen ligase domain-containing protein [Prauserella sp. ASG 168]|uniref:O-antigen ligase domain-containing protein n=1 Tax=Prauserella cavernicola TaxID=2800127 RepID=A0A934QQ73_9PSEU|nr:O-antigen ligase domain-containing protein [Prauserella cavernicola]